LDSYVELCVVIRKLLYRALNRREIKLATQAISLNTQDLSIVKFSARDITYSHMYCDMMPEHRKCAVREAQQTSITRQRLGRHVLAATDWLVEIKELVRN
jgi:hypothetical protein